MNGKEAVYSGYKEERAKYMEDVREILNNSRWRGDWIHGLGGPNRREEAGMDEKRKNHWPD